jgi:hypothetical protein
MNTFKLCLLAVVSGLSLHPGHARAVVLTHHLFANGVDFCQAFTPGPANTIRNRVVGPENVGTAPINVACDFFSEYNGTGSSNPVT